MFRSGLGGWLLSKREHRWSTRGRENPMLLLLPLEREERHLWRTNQRIVLLTYFSPSTFFFFEQENSCLLSSLVSRRCSRTRALSLFPSK